MSGFTTDQVETLYSSYAAGTTSVPTAAAVTFTAGLPPIEVPAYFMAATGARSSSLHLRILGRMTTTATIPSWIVGVAITTAQPGAFSASTVLLTSASVTPATAATNAPFVMDVETGLRTMALGAASTVTSQGVFRCPACLTATPNELTLPAAAGTFTLATWPVDQQVYLWPFVTLGAATAGNTLTVDCVKLFGERGG